MLFNSSVYISRHPVRLADKNCDLSVITLFTSDPVNSCVNMDGQNPFHVLISFFLSSGFLNLKKLQPRDKPKKKFYYVY